MEVGCSVLELYKRRLTVSEAPILVHGLKYSVLSSR